MVSYVLFITQIPGFSAEACGLAVLEWQPHPPAAAGCLPTHAPAETGGLKPSLVMAGFYHHT